jgi:hypothetical protein
LEKEACIMAEQEKIKLGKGAEGNIKVENDKVTIEIPNPDHLKLEDFKAGKELVKICGGCSGLVSLAVRFAS